MNTSLAIQIRDHLQEIQTDLEYTEVFSHGILKAGSEILSDPSMTTMAKRAIFQLGLYQNRDSFVLNDLYSELVMLDMRYRLSAGNAADFEDAGLSPAELHQLKNTLIDLKENTFDESLLRDEYLINSLRLVYEIAKREVAGAMHADSMLAICKLALKSGYRIIMEDGDLNSFGAGVFRNLFQPESPEELKSTKIVSCGCSFKVILNDAQNVFPLGEPITNRIQQVFPEAQSVILRVSRKVVLSNE